MSKTILITGGSRGIGKACADLLVDGNKVFAPSSLELDVSNQKSIDDYLREIKSLDALICNAGIYYGSNIEKHSIEEFSRVLDVNLTGSFRMIQSCLPLLHHGSKIILIASVSAYGDAGAPAYSASKAGMIAMMKSLAPELAHDGITINTINPGWVRTDMAHTLLPNKEAEAMALGATLLGRWIEPIEIAQLVEYLLRTDAICGEVINIDAGLNV
ncbi:MAG: SDR family NAD(P)-dependent oxidoreductase [Cyanobacteria bacterium]|nr:SDR family NAD(P)-dependent oxidoreductase [Cyanobacteriota bacterium]MDA1021079.1 SDR family NAD(P)-dependent oxidoreductase [Cyanobacteriota bacterium]